MRVLFLFRRLGPLCQRCMIGPIQLQAKTFDSAQRAGGIAVCGAGERHGRALYEYWQPLKMSTSSELGRTNICRALDSTPLLILGTNTVQCAIVIKFHGG